MREKEIFIKALNSVSGIECHTEAEEEKIKEIFGNREFEILALSNKSLGPDILIKNREFIHALEHFEVDASTNNDKGSHYKRENHHSTIQAERALFEQLQTGEKVVMYKGEFSTKFTYKNFFNNFKKHFIKHYKKIANYRYNLRAYDKERHEFYFLVEDATPIHSFVHDEDLNQDCLLNDVHFYNIIQSCPNIKGIIFLMHENINGIAEDRLMLLLNTPENIKELKQQREHKLFDGYKASKEMDTLKYIDIIIESDVEDN